MSVERPDPSPSDQPTLPPLATPAGVEQRTLSLAPAAVAANLQVERLQDSPTALYTAAEPALPRVPGYQLLGVLGQGGMGIVYKARQLGLNRIVALKMISAGEFAGVAALARFRTEAEALGRLRHPNIVQIYEVGEYDGKPFFSLEYCEGGTLSRLSGDPLPPREAARLGETLARAVQAAHEQGVIHRDLKPANILIADCTLQIADRKSAICNVQSAIPKITDFGVAKQLDTEGQTRTGDVVGTPSYMAPEQAGGRSRDVGPAVDIYALGAILYELLTGRPPFRAETPFDTLLQVLEHDPAPPRIVNASVPRDLETICLKCLEKSPARRYPTAAALADDLASFQAGEPITARSLNLVERFSAMLGRSQYDVQFSAYGTMLLWFALIVLLTELAVTWVVLTEQPPFALPLTQMLRLLALGLIFWHYTPGGIVLPKSAAERHMWSVWVGYIVTCTLIGMSYRMLTGMEVGLETKLYPTLSAVAGLAFFALASNYWGGCYAFGVAFYVLAPLMTRNLDWAPVEFGVLWAVALTTIGLRLRQMGTPRS